MQQAIQQIRTQILMIEQYEQIQQRTKQNHSTTKGINDNSTATLIPIQLRMEFPGRDNSSCSPPIRYQDDFLWDHANDLLSPIQMAHSIVQDLQLPHDAVPTITIHILEQIVQYTMRAKNTNSTRTGSDDNDVDMHHFEDDEGMQMGPSILLPPPTPQQQQAPAITATAAWEISHALHNTNMIHLETFHKTSSRWTDQWDASHSTKETDQRKRVHNGYFAFFKIWNCLKIQLLASYLKWMVQYCQNKD